MKRNKIMKKILAMVMTAAMALTSAAPAAGTVITAEAATKAVSENLLVNPDFEETTAFSPAGGSHAGNWFVWQNASKTTDDAYSGKTSVKFTGSDSALEQDLTNLQVGTTYVYTVWAKLSKTSASADHMIGVKNYGGSEIKLRVTSTEWEIY